MKIIYDKKEAIQKKERIDKEVEEKNKEAEKRNKKLRKTLFWIFIPIFIAIAAVTISGLFFNFAADKVGWVCFGSFVEIILLFVAVGIYGHCEAGFSYHDYPADVRYFMATDKEKILRIYTEKCDSCTYDLKVEIEREDHTVKTVTAASLGFSVRTDITEEIVDLKEGKCHIPYEKK